MQRNSLFKSVRKAQSNTALQDFLKAMPAIRITSDDTPGFGNQAASEGIIAWLRTQGFAGAIELIYPRETLYKITTLYDLPAAIPSPYEDREKRITFITTGDYAARLLNQDIQQVTLGLSGGSEINYCEIARSEGVALNSMPPITCENRANFAKVDVFLNMSPFYAGSNSIHRYNVALNDNNALQANSHNLFLLTPHANLQDGLHYLQEDPRGIALLQQKPALKTYVQGLLEKRFYALPTYGFTIQQDGFGFSESIPWNILMLIAAAKQALLAENTRRPLIMPVFYDYCDELTILNDLINHRNWSILEASPQGKNEATSVIEKLHLPGHVQMVDLADANAADIITQLPADDILIISMGALTRTVFDAIYTYHADNIFPQVFEGENAFASLVESGLPMLRCRSYWDLEEVDVLQDPEFQAWLGSFYNKYACTYRNGWEEFPSGQLVDELAKYIITARDPNSRLAAYFRALKIYAEQHERIPYGLEGAIKMLGTKPPVAAAQIKTHPDDLITQFIIEPVATFKLWAVPYLQALSDTLSETVNQETGYWVACTAMTFFSAKAAEAIGGCLSVNETTPMLGINRA